MKEGEKFKFRGDNHRVIKECGSTILAVNEDVPLENIKRFANLELVIKNANSIKTKELNKPVLAVVIWGVYGRNYF